MEGPVQMLPPKLGKRCEHMPILLQLSGRCFIALYRYPNEIKVTVGGGKGGTAG